MSWSIGDVSPYRCPNFLLCGTEHPKMEFRTQDGRCTHCDISFNKNLSFRYITEECFICTEEKTLFVQGPSCQHWQCVDCFSLIYNQRNDIQIGEHNNNNTMIEDEGEEEECEEDDDDDEGEYDDDDEEEDEEQYFESCVENGFMYNGGALFGQVCPFCRTRNVPAWAKQAQSTN